MNTSGDSRAGTFHPSTRIIGHSQRVQWGVAFSESDLDQVEEISAKKISADGLGAKAYFELKSPESGM